MVFLYILLASVMNYQEYKDIFGDDNAVTESPCEYTVTKNNESKNTAEVDKVNFHSILHNNFIE